MAHTFCDIFDIFSDISWTKTVFWHYTAYVVLVASNWYVLYIFPDISWTVFWHYTVFLCCIVAAYVRVYSLLGQWTAEKMPTAHSHSINSAISSHDVPCRDKAHQLVTTSCAMREKGASTRSFSQFFPNGGKMFLCFFSWLHVAYVWAMYIYT